MGMKNSGPADMEDAEVSLSSLEDEKSIFWGSLRFWVEGEALGLEVECLERMAEIGC